MTLKISARNIESDSKKVAALTVRLVTNSINDEDMSALGKFIARLIKIRTRLGFGVSENGTPKKKLKELSGRPKPYKSTIHQREIAKKKGELSKETTPIKSNLTMTGRMLDSITIAVSKLKVIVSIPNSSRPDSKATNKEIARYNEEKGRPFFHVSDSEIRQIKREAARIIKSKLGKGLTKL